MRHTLEVLSRVLAAVVGGYGFASVLAIWLTRILPVRPAAAVMTGLLCSFLLYTLAVIWVFAVRTPTRAWIGLALPVLIFGAWAWLLGQPAS